MPGLVGARLNPAIGYCLLLSATHGISGHCLVPIGADRATHRYGCVDWPGSGTSLTSLTSVRSAVRLSPGPLAGKKTPLGSSGPGGVFYWGNGAVLSTSTACRSRPGRAPEWTAHGRSSRNRLEILVDVAGENRPDVLASAEEGKLPEGTWRSSVANRRLSLSHPKQRMEPRPAGLSTT